MSSERERAWSAPVYRAHGTFDSLGSVVAAPFGC